jgi:hypothetical protein
MRPGPVPVPATVRTGGRLRSERSDSSFPTASPGPGGHDLPRSDLSWASLCKIQGGLLKNDGAQRLHMAARVWGPARPRPSGGRVLAENYRAACSRSTHRSKLKTLNPPRPEQGGDSCHFLPPAGLAPRQQQGVFLSTPLRVAGIVRPGIAVTGAKTGAVSTLAHVQTGASRISIRVLTSRQT